MDRLALREQIGLLLAHRLLRLEPLDGHRLRPSGVVDAHRGFRPRRQRQLQFQGLAQGLRAPGAQLVGAGGLQNREAAGVQH